MTAGHVFLNEWEISHFPRLLGMGTSPPFFYSTSTPILFSFLQKERK
jgi:hypothetical protein